MSLHTHACTWVHTCTMEGLNASSHMQTAYTPHIACMHMSLRPLWSNTPPPHKAQLTKQLALVLALVGIQLVHCLSFRGKQLTVRDTLQPTTPGSPCTCTWHQPSHPPTPQPTTPPTNHVQAKKLPAACTLQLPSLQS